MAAWRKELGPRAAACVRVASLIAVASGSVGCATAYSPRMVRNEIARQTGQDPRGVFELSLGRPALALAKTVLGTPAGGTLPLGAVTALELASYEVAAGAAGIDLTRVPSRGWEPFIRFREGSRSAVVLVRPEGEAIGDLVLIAADAGQVLYARLRGRLARDVPEALVRSVRSDGPDALRRELLTMVGETR